MNFDINELRRCALKALQIWHSHPEAKGEASFQVVITGHINCALEFRWIYLGREGENWVYAINAQDVLNYVMRHETEARAIEQTRNQLTNQFKN